MIVYQNLTQMEVKVPPDGYTKLSCWVVFITGETARKIIILMLTFGGWPEAGMTIMEEKMADDTDVCATCSVKFADLKCVLMCITCSKFFHASCEGISDLRGLAKKRPTWKCSACSGKTESMAAEPTKTGGVKRFKCNSGDMVEVDRLLLENMFSMMQDLSSSITDLKNQVSSLQKDNFKLNEMMTSFVVVNSQSHSDGFSYAMAIKTNPKVNVHAQVNKPTVNTDPFIFGVKNSNQNVASSNPDLFNASMVNAAIHNATVSTAIDPSKSSKSGQTKDHPKRRRTNKSAVIGSRKDQASANGSSQIANNVPALECAEKRSWFYLGRIKAGSTPENVASYIKSNCAIAEVTCIALANTNIHCSFKIGVKESVSNALLDGDKWPKGVILREFVNYQKRKPKSVDHKMQVEALNSEENFREIQDPPNGK